jgi:hypothetical protein
VTTQPQNLESVFSRAWELLTRNWIMIVPGIIIGIIVGVIKALLTPTILYNADGTVVIGSAMAMAGSGLLVGFIGMLGYLITQGIASAMAAAAWQRGTTTLDDATGNINKLLPTAGILFLLIIVATIISLPTLFLSFLAYYLFTLYAFPATVISNVSGFEAVKRSFRLTLARFVPTAIIAALIFVIGLCAAFIGGALHFVPFLGPIVSAVLSQIVVAYAMLVIVGEYLNLEATGGATAYASGPSPYTPGSGAYTPPSSGGYTPPPPSGGYAPPPPSGGYTPPPPPVEPYEKPPG